MKSLPLVENHYNYFKLAIQKAVGLFLCTTQNGWSGGQDSHEGETFILKSPS